ncbi:MAG: NAD(P)-dependent oxidoreductase [Candidatus Nanohaloarchaea archaeon]
MNNSILITGASGTVAKASARELKDHGFTVIGVSRSVENDAEEYTRTERLDLLESGDLEQLEDLMEEVDAVFHLAWNLTVENFDTGEKWPENIEMFENVVNAAKNSDVDILINGSSIHAGTGDISAYTVEASLEDTPEPYRSSIDPESEFDLRKEDPEKLLDPREDNPDSPYGESKIETEKKLRKAVEKNDFKLGISIRIGGINSEDKTELDGEPFYSSLYWSHRDIGRTLKNILESDLNEKKGYHQFYGVSDNKGRIFNIENSFTSPKQ